MYGFRLKQVRERIGVTQKQAADILGIDASHYNHIESEDEIIPLKHLIKLCVYFDVSLDYIFEFTDDKKYKSATSAVSSIEVGKRLKEFRKEYKITQSKLALELHTTQSVIADYERGRYLIATPFLYTISKNYKVSTDYLLGKINKPKYLK